MMKAISSLVTVAMMCGACAPFIGRSDVPVPNAGLLMNSTMLAQRMGTEDVVVLHVGTSRAEYDAGHIPGARFLPLGSILSERDGNTNELPEIAHLETIFRDLGIARTSHVVVYGAPLHAARAFFTLDYLGIASHTSLLDGGLVSWKAAGNPVSTEAPAPKTGNFESRLKPLRLVDAQWVRSKLNDDDVVLIDARPADQYSGAVAGADVTRPGHIPGAINIFWEDMMLSVADGTLKDAATLTGMFEDADIEEDDAVVVYCRTGMQASMAYFVARYLGYDAIMYDPSYIDWSRRSEMPVQRGAR